MTLNRRNDDSIDIVHNRDLVLVKRNNIWLDNGPDLHFFRLWPKLLKGHSQLFPHNLANALFV